MANENSIDTTHDLFMHDLRSIYYFERQLKEELDNMAGEITNKKNLSNLFVKHQEETSKQVRRLNLVFEHIDENADENGSAGLSGLIEDIQHLNDNITEPDMLNIAFLNSAIKAERIEITMYEGLLRMVEELEFDDKVKDFARKKTSKKRKKPSENSKRMQKSLGLNRQSHGLYLDFRKRTIKSFLPSSVLTDLLFLEDIFRQRKLQAYHRPC